MDLSPLGDWLGADVSGATARGPMLGFFDSVLALNDAWSHEAMTGCVHDERPR
jgi:hypothetical protein